MRLNPLDPAIEQPLRHAGMAYALFMTGRYRGSCGLRREGIGATPDFMPALRVGAATYALLEQAKRRSA